LEQIQENVDEVSAIIEDLMSFAQPIPPRSTLTDIRQIIDEAVQLASQKTGTIDVNFQIDVAADVTNVFVDSAQIASALANIISNSIESYSDEVGPVNITVCRETGDNVKLRITDLGCGMDEKTLHKVTYPFFSAKPAGRKRGMGLAYAQRLVRLNKGSFQITSEAGNGTTVTIRLPSRQIS
jgi:signal transduction histidine kinase